MQRSLGWAWTASPHQACGGPVRATHDVGLHRHPRGTWALSSAVTGHRGKRQQTTRDDKCLRLRLQHGGQHGGHVRVPTERDPVPCGRTGSHWT